VRSWRNSSAVAQNMFTDHKISESEHRSWFAGMKDDARTRYWIIELEGRPVGVANVVAIDFDNKDAAWAFYLADEATRGKGVGLYVEYCVLDCVFDFWRLDRLRCEVLTTNLGVCALHESVGFKQTGRAIKHGKPVDAVSYSMTKSEWNSIYKQRLAERIRSRGRCPLPLLSMLESAPTKS